jgi:hypothetical protein
MTMPSLGLRLIVPAGVILAVLIGCLGESARAQTATYRGTASCVKSGCHQKEKDWFEKEDGPPPNQHRNGFEQLTRDLDKSKKYAGSIGLTDPQDPGGRCVECHAPPQRTRFRDGVSCEVCHGPGSAYYDIHDDEPYKTNGYPKSLKLGMFPLLDSPNVWAERCMNCHVLQEAKLIAAGHPSGDDFDLAVKFRVVASPNGNHWKANYAQRAAEVGKFGRGAGDRIRAMRTGKPAPVPTAAAPTPAPAAPTPAAATAAAVPVAPPTPSPIPVPAAPAAIPQPVPPVPPPAAAAASPGVTRPAAVPPPTAKPPSAAAPPAPAVARPSPPPAAAPPPALPPASPPPAMSSPMATGAATGGGVARSPAALVAAVQGRAIELLTSLLQRGGVTPVRIIAPPASSYTGPDAELLQLQREALQLALTALGTAPAPPK